jgi:transcriptional regulator with XRE-family HTH domain
MAGTFDLGEFIRDQRRTAQISVRQLARLAGVSNPYLSQIERGLRRPSAEILQQIAKGLRISAEALYVQAGILDERIAGGVVVDAVIADTTLTERQKQVMLEVYDSFRKENLRRDADQAAQAAQEAEVLAISAALDQDEEAAPWSSLGIPTDDPDGAGAGQARPPRPAQLRSTMRRSISQPPRSPR